MQVQLMPAIRSCLRILIRSWTSSLCSDNWWHLSRRQFSWIKQTSPISRFTQWTCPLRLQCINRPSTTLLWWSKILKSTPKQERRRPTPKFYTSRNQVSIRNRVAARKTSTRQMPPSGQSIWITHRWLTTRIWFGRSKKKSRNQNIQVSTRRVFSIRSLCQVKFKIFIQTLRTSN
jgi:hypothetical protein